MCVCAYGKILGTSFEHSNIHTVFIRPGLGFFKCTFGFYSHEFYISSPKNILEDTVFQVQRENLQLYFKKHFYVRVFSRLLTEGQMPRSVSVVTSHGS